MSESKIGRRAFIQGAGLAALGAVGMLSADAAQVAGAVPNSAGTEVPKLKAPPLSCDCHQHIYDPARFPGAANGMAADARVAAARGRAQMPHGQQAGVRRISQPRDQVFGGRVRVAPEFRCDEGAGLRPRCAPLRLRRHNSAGHCGQQRSAREPGIRGHG